MLTYENNNKSIINNYMKPIQYYAYELIDSLTNQVIYVGKGKGSRMYYHIKAVLNGTHVNGKLKGRITSILQNGGTIKYNKIETVDESSAFLKEVELIQKYKTLGINLCNLTDGGEGISGHTFKKSEESKKKVSAKLKGIPKTEVHKKSLKSAKTNNPNNAKYWLNKSFSAEHIEKLKERANNRDPMKPETKLKISINNKQKERKGKSNEDVYGKEKADSMREKIRIRKLGKSYSVEINSKKGKHGNHHPTAVLFKITFNSVEFYYVAGLPGLKRFCKEFNLKIFSFVFDDSTNLAISKSHPDWKIEKLGRCKDFTNIEYRF